MGRFTHLKQHQRETLGLFKALELSNVCSKLELTEVEPELADTISKMVRRTMRERQIVMGGSKFPLKDKELKEIIDLGARQFALGKSNKEIWLEACELSNLMCKELNQEIYRGLGILSKLVPGYTPELKHTIVTYFLNTQLIKMSA